MVPPSFNTYVPGDSSVHHLDARSKTIVLLVYSVSLFFIDTWVGMVVAALLFCIAFFASSLSAQRVFSLVIPVYVIVGFTLIFNGFAYIPPEMQSFAPAGTLRVGGDIFLSAGGFERGCFFGIRILLLVWASLILCFTTTSTALTAAFASFMAPLRHFKVPVDDIAMVFSIALRFIPQTAAEYFAIRDAQWSRGASFDEGPLLARVKAHCVILIPLFIDLFRRADSLAMAMDVRCYGLMGKPRTSVRSKRMDGRSGVAMVSISALCILVAVLL